MSSAYFLLLMLSVFFSLHGNKNLAFSIKDHNSLETAGNNIDVDILGNYTPQSNFIAAVTRNKGFMFTMEVLVGTPPKKQKLVLDIGSDLTWIQCYPTERGFLLLGPIYDRSDSTSFGAIPASHHLCDGSKGYGSTKGGSRCAYEFKDFANKIFGGFLARDMFHLESSMAVNGLVFGCSDDNEETMFPADHADIAGVFGLGDGDLSLPSQFRGVVEDKFAYCVPREGGQSYLHFGSDIRPPPHGAKVASMIDPSPTLKSKYLLKLTSVIVDGKLLNLHQSYKCAIDTRSRMSRIPAIIRKKLVPEIDRYLESRGIKRAKEKRSPCYHTPPGFADYPTVSFNIGGATLHLRGEQLFYLAERNHDKHIMCFGMLTNQRTFITIGLMQQMHTRFIFDLRARQITFAADKDCANL